MSSFTEGGYSDDLGTKSRFNLNFTEPSHSSSRFVSNALAIIPRSKNQRGSCAVIILFPAMDSLLEASLTCSAIVGCVELLGLCPMVVSNSW